jgi:hypothetical protein
MNDIIAIPDWTPKTLRYVVHIDIYGTYDYTSSTYYAKLDKKPIKTIYNPFKDKDAQYRCLQMATSMKTRTEKFRQDKGYLHFLSGIGSNIHICWTRKIKFEINGFMSKFLYPRTKGGGISHSGSYDGFTKEEIEWLGHIDVGWPIYDDPIKHFRGALFYDPMWKRFVKKKFTMKSFEGVKRRYGKDKREIKNLHGHIGIITFPYIYKVSYLEVSEALCSYIESKYGKSRHLTALKKMFESDTVSCKTFDEYIEKKIQHIKNTDLTNYIDYLNAETEKKKRQHI